jgi:sec-independent protein translocase protein TatA
MPGAWEVIVLLAVVLVFFGSSRLPKLARSLGSSMTEFKKGLRGDAPKDDEKPKLEGDGEGDDASSASSSEKADS